MSSKFAFPSEENNIDGDPLLYQNGTPGDYLLSEYSPCIDVD